MNTDHTSNLETHPTHGAFKTKDSIRSEQPIDDQDHFQGFNNHQKINFKKQQPQQQNLQNSKPSKPSNNFDDFEDYPHAYTLDDDDHNIQNQQQKTPDQYKHFMQMQGLQQPAQNINKPNAYIHGSGNDDGMVVDDIDEDLYYQEDDD